MRKLLQNILILLDRGGVNSMEVFLYMMVVYSSNPIGASACKADALSFFLTLYIQSI